MGPITATITIDAPRERIYELLADLAKRPAFCDHFASPYHLQRLESRGVGAAARFHVDAPRFPIWLETEITELEPPRRIVERGHGSRADRMELGTVWELVEGPGETTDVTVTFWTEPGNSVDEAKAKLGAARWYRKQWRTALRRVRDMVEAGEAVEPLRVAGASHL